MFLNWKRKYINWQIKKFLKKHKRQKNFINWDDAKTVLLLVSHSHLNRNFLSSVVEMMGDKDIHIWCFKEGKELPKLDNDLVTLFNSKSISFFQKPNKIIVNKYLAIKADLLLDLTIQEALPLKYLVGISQAPCRCGLTKDDFEIYDFKMDMKGKVDPIDLLSQILYYLKIIKSK
jgi:hypothetical protein